MLGPYICRAFRYAPHFFETGSPCYTQGIEQVLSDCRMVGRIQWHVRHMPLTRMRRAASWTDSRRNARWQSAGTFTLSEKLSLLGGNVELMQRK